MSSGIDSSPRMPTSWLLLRLACRIDRSLVFPQPARADPTPGERLQQALHPRERGERGEHSQVVASRIERGEEQASAIPVELPRVADELLAVLEAHAHLAGRGRPRLVKVLRLVVCGVPVEAPNEEDRLEIRHGDLDALGIWVTQGNEAQARLVRIEI